MARIKSTTLNLRIDPDLKRQADWAADQDRRSLTNYIEWLIEEDLKRRAGRALAVKKKKT